MFQDEDVEIILCLNPIFIWSPSFVHSGQKPTYVWNVQPSHQDKMLALTFVQTTDTSTFLRA